MPELLLSKFFFLLDIIFIYINIITNTFLDFYNTLKKTRDNEIDCISVSWYTKEILYYEHVLKIVSQWFLSYAL